MEPGSDRSEAPLLARYMRDLAPVRILSREQELRLARQIRQARLGLVAIFRELPEPSRSKVVGTDDSGARAGWRLERVEASHARLVDLAAADVTLAAVTARAWEEKQALDRARDAIIVANLPLVIGLAKRFSGRGVAFLDLVQEGNLGLIEAVERFDFERGFRFGTYAVWWIKRGFSRAFSEKGRLIRLPENAALALKQIRRTAAELERELGRAPDHAAIAARLGLPIWKVVELVGAAAEPRPLEAPRGDDASERCLLSTIPDRTAADPLEALIQERLDGDVARALAVLGGRERAVLRLRFGLEGTERHTLTEVGAVLGISRERVRQIEQSTLRKLQARS